MAAELLHTVSNSILPKIIYSIINFINTITFINPINSLQIIINRILASINTPA